LAVMFRVPLRPSTIGRNAARGVAVPALPHKPMRILEAPELERVAAAVPSRYKALALLLWLRGPPHRGSHSPAAG
jgi:hypothetical protein